MTFVIFIPNSSLESRQARAVGNMIQIDSKDSRKLKEIG